MKKHDGPTEFQMSLGFDSQARTGGQDVPKGGSNVVHLKFAQKPPQSIGNSQEVDDAKLLELVLARARELD